MDINPIVLSIPIYFILIAVEWTYDLIKHKNYYRLSDATANIGCGIVEQVSGLFAKVFTLAAYYFVWQHFRITDIPNTALSIFVLWLGVDFCYYWAHRHSHTVNLFWIGHSIHHQSEDYNLSVALRQGALQKVFTFWYYFPLAIAGFDPQMFLLVGAFNTLYQFWIHTEMIGKMGWFEYVFNTPSHHRVHHARNPKYIDKNHAGSLIIWDKMFGTFAKEEEHPTYGVTKAVQTFDPVAAHVKPVLNLLQDLKRVNGLGNKFKLLFMPPGWYPAAQGGYVAPPAITQENSKKFSTQLAPRLNAYLFVQFLVVLGATAYFLFTAKGMNFNLQLFSASAILISMAALGGIFSQQRYGVALEYMRQIAQVMIFIAAFFSQNDVSFAAFAIVPTVNLVWFWWALKTQQPQNNHEAALVV